MALTRGMSPPQARPQVDLGLRAQSRRAGAWIIGLVLLLLITILAGICLGSAAIHPGEAVGIVARHVGFGSPDSPTPQDTIVWAIRTPRTLLAVMVGAGLASSGVVLQAVVRNPLADPYLLGINSGASCGAAAAILFGLGSGLASGVLLQTSAFLGALAASVLVFAIAQHRRRLIPLRLLLAGVAVGYALSAATSFLIFSSDSAEGSRSVMFWLLGSLGLAAWDGALVVSAIVLALCLTVMHVQARRLDALSIGDDTTLSLGINPDRLRAVVLVVVCLLVGVLVAMAGSIGFIGLVVPHLARRLVGSTHRFVLPVSALIGASLLVVADILARVIIAPQELPIGIITAIIGAPFLLLLVRRTT